MMEYIVRENTIPKKKNDLKKNIMNK